MDHTGHSLRIRVDKIEAMAEVEMRFASVYGRSAGLWQVVVPLIQGATKNVCFQNQSSDAPQVGENGGFFEACCPAGLAKEAGVRIICKRFPAPDSDRHDAMASTLARTLPLRRTSA